MWDIYMGYACTYAHRHTHTHSVGVLKEEGNSGTCYNMDEP